MKAAENAGGAAPLPLVYACSGCSSAAQLANHLAVRLVSLLSPEGRLKLI